MALGSHQNTDKIFLSVGFGKLRQKSLANREKVTADTPNAVKRETQSGKDSWALEYDFIEGLITFIYFKEDKEYGDSYEVTIQDGLDHYQISFKSDSRFWYDFAKKLPNIDLSEPVKITCYDFEDKVSGKRKAGVSILQNKEKVLSFYDKKDGDKWVLLHGFPDGSAVDWNNKKKSKIFLMEVEEFLHDEFDKRIAPQFDMSETHNNTVANMSADDIPGPPKEKTVTQEILEEDNSGLPF